MIYTFCGILEYEEVKLLQRSNSRREERLKRVRTKNFQKKEEDVEVKWSQYTIMHHSIPLYTTVYHSIPMYTTVYHSISQYTLYTVYHRISCIFLQVEYAESCAQARRVAAELHRIRRDFISQASSTIFPIEVEALSQKDAGEEGKGEGGGKWERGKREGGGGGERGEGEGKGRGGRERGEGEGKGRGEREREEGEEKGRRGRKKGGGGGEREKGEERRGREGIGRRGRGKGEGGE